MKDLYNLTKDERFKNTTIKMVDVNDDLIVVTVSVLCYYSIKQLQELNECLVNSLEEVLISKSNFDKNNIKIECKFCFENYEKYFTFEQKVSFVSEFLQSELIENNQEKLFEKITFEKDDDSILIVIENNEDEYVNPSITNFVKEKLDQLNLTFPMQVKQNELSKKQEENTANKYNNGGVNRRVAKSKIEKLSIGNISDIPFTMEEDDKPVPCRVKGEIFGCEIQEFKNGALKIATIKIVDGEDAITVKMFLKDNDKDKDYLSLIKVGQSIVASGSYAYDKFSKDVVVTASWIESYVSEKENARKDTYDGQKRVELHLHTKMSTMDAVTNISDYVKQAQTWGHTALALTDHDGMYAVPEFYNSTKKSDLKPIYGVELSVYDDSATVTFNEKEIDLESATYVIYDLETTGFSAKYDSIIEIGAVKIKDNQIIDEFQMFINPKEKLSDIISELTNITDDMLVDAPLAPEALNEFKKFIEGSILVAHNATFDLSHLDASFKKHGLGNVENPVIDTLRLARVMYHDKLKRFGLKAMTKFFKVKLDDHHRAIFDAKATQEVFLFMLNDLLNIHSVTKHNEINELVTNQLKRNLVFDTHTTFLAKNEKGLKQLFELVSQANTTHMINQKGMIPISLINDYRSDLFVGSSCMQGEVWEYALNRSYEDLLKVAKFYDYLEVQPPMCFKHLQDVGGWDDERFKERIQGAIKTIIKVGKELNKIVVASGDVHYLSPNDKKYREVYTVVPSPGGGLHPLGRQSIKTLPDQHFLTTGEMLEQFSFLGDELAQEIVIKNTNLIADKIELVKPIKDELFTPSNDFLKNKGIEYIPDEVKRLCYEKAKQTYGDDLPSVVIKSLEKELKSIIDNGFAVIYYISALLVKKSLKDGYLVGSRGSVGSSLVATMLEISEVNPLPPHYVCPKCKFYAFKGHDDSAFDALGRVDSGYDLPDEVCPKCGENMTKDGHDIPFETFLGFEGDKVPDIDLNFSGEYQPTAHNYCKELFGEDYAFRAGTISTVAEKTAFGFVRMYGEKKNKNFRNAYIEYMAKFCQGVKRTTGQHPGGIIVVPNYMDIFDITPVQYPANDSNAEWKTTHFDFHSIHDNLLKLDILGHDDPTTLKYLEKISGIDPKTIPVDDPNIYKMFNGTECLGVTSEQIGSKTGSFGIPEFGTSFVRGMLEETKPTSFGELVKISGLSHGTDVWLNNAQDLVKKDICEFKEVIGCRDDIMVYLQYQGLEPKLAFTIMESVRKGKGLKQEWENEMKKNSVPDWYIDSCKKIKYMFPKAHATAYVLMAMRIAWFKLYKPLYFYSAYFSKRADQFDLEAMLGGENAVRAKLDELSKIPKKTATEAKLGTTLELVLEMLCRGISFINLDVNTSHENDFLVDEENNSLILPFKVVDGLGGAVAEKIVKERAIKKFELKDDFKKRTKVSKTVLEKLDKAKATSGLFETKQTSLFDLGL